MRVYGHRVHAKLMSSSEDPDSDLRPIGYEKLVWVIRANRRVPPDVLDRMLVGLVIDVVLVIVVLVLLIKSRHAGRGSLETSVVLLKVGIGRVG